MQKANAIKRIVAESTLVRMCDPALETSPEALLARISALEDKLAYGQLTVATPTPATKEIPAEQISAPAKQEKETVAPGHAPAQNSEPVHRAPAPKAAPAVQAENTRTLRPLRAWADVLEKLTKAVPAVAAFYFGAKAFTDESGNVILKFKSDFEISMAKNYNAVPTLCGILSNVLGSPVTDARVKFECQGKQDTASVLDEILDIAED